MKVIVESKKGVSDNKNRRMAGIRHLLQSQNLISIKIPQSIAQNYSAFNPKLKKPMNPSFSNRRFCSN